MKFIVVIIHKIKYYSIIWEEEFINDNEFTTQNTIIKTLKLLGLDEKDNEIERLNNIINECADGILKELQENHHLSYGVALAIRQKLINYRELRESAKHESK